VADTTASRQVVVANPLGLHARAAARFVHAAGRFACQVRVTVWGQTVDGKSILGLLLLSAARGTTIEIAADGVDAAEAVEALVALTERGFDDP
jgi:phosphocarrier protein HPr